MPLPEVCNALNRKLSKIVQDDFSHTSACVKRTQRIGESAATGLRIIPKHLMPLGSTEKFLRRHPVLSRSHFSMIVHCRKEGKEATGEGGLGIKIGIHLHIDSMMQRDSTNLRVIVKPELPRGPDGPVF